MLSKEDSAGALRGEPPPPNVSREFIAELVQDSALLAEGDGAPVEWRTSTVRIRLTCKSDNSDLKKQYAFSRRC